MANSNLKQIKLKKKKQKINWPFPSCCEPQYQSESKCKIFNMKISFHSYANKTNFHMKSFAPWPLLQNEVHRNTEMAYSRVVLGWYYLKTYSFIYISQELNHFNWHKAPFFTRYFLFIPYFFIIQSSILALQFPVVTKPKQKHCKCTGCNN